MNTKNLQDCLTHEFKQSTLNSENRINLYLYHWITPTSLPTILVAVHAKIVRKYM